MANAYIPHDWASNELITETQLNHIEQGIKNADEKAALQIKEITKDNTNFIDLVKQVLNTLEYSVNVNNKTLMINVVQKNN